MFTKVKLFLLVIQLTTYIMFSIHTCFVISLFYMQILSPVADNTLIGHNRELLINSPSCIVGIWTQKNLIICIYFTCKMFIKVIFLRLYNLNHTFSPKRVFYFWCLWNMCVFYLERARQFGAKIVCKNLGT